MRQRVRGVAAALIPALVVALLAAVASGTSASSVDAGSQANVRLTPLTTRVDWADGDFTVTIEISDLDHHGTVLYDDDRDGEPDREELTVGLGAFEVVLHFDPGVLEVADVDAGDFFEGSSRSAQCLQRVPERGQYALGCVTTGSGEGPQGSGVLATVTLTPLANGVSFIAMETQLSGPLAEPVPATAIGGVVEVFGAPGDAPTPDPVSTPDATDDPIEGSPPTVIGGGEPGVVGLPPTGPGANGVPVAGTGYEPRDATVWSSLLGAMLALAGAAVLLGGALLAARPRRS